MKKILTLLLMVMVVATAMLFTACNNSDTKMESNIYLGEYKIVAEGTQKSLGFPNISYEYSTNTLTIRPSIFKYSYCGAKSYDNIFLGGLDGDTGSVSFLFTYSGTKDLNIVMYGDSRFINDCETASTIFGGIYVENATNVNIKGPGQIITTNLTHSVLYGKSAFVNFDDISVQSNNNTCSFGIACDQASFVDCNIDVKVTDYGYSGLYIPNGTYDTRTSFNATGFDYGYYIGSTFMYDGCVLESHNTKEMAANFYALEAYDATLKLSSDSCGIACYDGATFNNCTGFIYSDCLYGFNSLEATFIFNNCDFDVKVNEGAGIQAWRNFFFDSRITVTSLVGFGINSEYNMNVEPTDNPGIYIYNSYINAKASKAAIYSVADLVIEGSVLTNEQKVLGKLVERFDNNIMKAICEKTETELVLTGEETEIIYPTNAATNVVIELAKTNNGPVKPTTETALSAEEIDWSNALYTSSYRFELLKDTTAQQKAKFIEDYSTEGPTTEKPFETLIAEYNNDAPTYTYYLYKNHVIYLRVDGFNGKDYINVGMWSVCDGKMYIWDALNEQIVYVLVENSNNTGKIGFEREVSVDNDCGVKVINYFTFDKKSDMARYRY